MKPKYYRVNTLVHLDLKKPVLADFHSRYKSFRDALANYISNDDYVVYGVGKEQWDAIIVCFNSPGNAMHCIKIYERFFNATSAGHIDAVLDYSEREHLTALETIGKRTEGFNPVTTIGNLIYAPNSDPFPRNIRLYNYNTPCPEDKREELTDLIMTGVVDEVKNTDRNIKYIQSVVNNTLGKVNSETNDTLVYVEDDKIVGMVIYEHQPNQISELTSLVVASAYRRRGIATKLLKAVASIPHMQRTLYCSFENANKPSVELFTGLSNFKGCGVIYAHQINRENLLWKDGELRGRVKRFDVE